MKKKISFFLFLASFYALGGEELDDLLKMSFEELSKVKVTGSTRQEENIKAVPSSVTVFTHKELQRMGVDTLGELMNLVPGFQSYRSSNSSMLNQFSSRGRRISFSNSEILVLVDGQRLDEPRNSGSSQLASKYPLKNIERVEFIRGPGAAVYGSNAMMGVVNIITLSGVNEVSLGYSSFNRRQGHLLLSRQIGEVALDIFAKLESDDGDDYDVPDTFSGNRIGTDDPRTLADLNLKLSWQDTHLNFQHIEAKADSFYVLNQLSNTFNKREEQYNSISLKQDFAWLPVDSYLELSYSRSSTKVNSQLTAPGSLAAISNPSSNDPLYASADFDDYTETRLHWHNDWEIDSYSNLQFGIEHRHIHAPEAIVKNNFDLGQLVNGNFPIAYYGEMIGTTSGQARSSRDIIGLYCQYQRHLFDATHLTLGLRYDDFSSIGSKVSPRVGLVHELNDNHSIKLLYGEAFRAPAESELNLQNNPVVLGNPNLDPESVKSWEVIWLGQWTHTGFSLGYFENRFKDSIVQTSISGTTKYENVDQDPTKGVELEIFHDLNENWLIRGTYTYISEKPDLSFREAEHLASAMINYHQNKWNVNLIATWQGSRKTPTGGSVNNRITLNDYWLLSGKLTYNFSTTCYAFLQVKNILDEKYESPATGLNLTEGVANRGREIFAGVTWSF